ncbi:MAG: biotin carboxylase N-terminal domain-containing protein [Candidatus Tectimicrobiota bacterium]
MALSHDALRQPPDTPIAVETMRTLLVCRGPIAFETLQIYRQQGWQVPHVVVSSREWIAELQRTAPWIADLPPEQVHYVQEYNDVEAILSIARAQAIDAIYPGYGFLAEQADFAERVEQAGIRFIGPTPQTLRAVGDKDAAIALARQLGIPTIPGDDSLIAYAQTQAQAATTAETVRRVLAMAQRHPGYPLRLKHPAGGGGKGQRVLTAEVLNSAGAEAAISDALSKIWSEMGVSAVAADASKGVLLELNVPRPLHWEVQIFGDGETVVHFAARDCSLQNHGYQKFIEVALHPQAIAQEIARLAAQPARAARSAALQQRLATLDQICTAALRLGTAVRLRGAATVEFLIDQQGQAYFLEVNPRIQVEHGVTEGIARVHGQPLSLVAWQQRVAAGEKLPFRQEDIAFTGDAIEVRLNAWHEDLSPVLGGVVQALRLDVPAENQAFVRLEAGGLLQRRHAWIVPSYDANFALLIVTGQERHEVLERLIAVLDQAVDIQGNAELKTNVQPLLGLLTLMQALPAETEFRTDTSLLWMALTAVLETQKQHVLGLIPDFPRRPQPDDPARFARLLRATLETAFAHPSRLLMLYLQRLQQPDPRPLAALEVLWQLAAALAVPLFPEEREQGAALLQAIEAFWQHSSSAGVSLPELLREATQPAAVRPAFEALCAQVQPTLPDLPGSAVADLVRTFLHWCSVDIPAITALLQALEHTQVHTFLSGHEALGLPRPAYLEDANTVLQLHHVLSQSLRPTLLRHGELLSPMEATIYHYPEPGAPPFVEVGAEISVGQTLALLEAMKMFTELPSPVDGVLVEILVENGQGVKTGTPLFKIATQEALPPTADTALHQAVASVFENRFGLFRAEHTS